MSRESVESNFKDRVNDVGRAALAALFPNDIEEYLLALELVDSGGNTVDYFAWPILPDEIRDTHQEITTVKKTIGGIYVLKNTTFAPRQISISGTFGRRFKLLLNNHPVSFAGFSASQKNGKFNISAPNFLGKKVPEFSSFAKSGYGCIKVLESMKEKSKQVDGRGKPHSLYLYNPILGNNYQVEFMNFSHMQDKDQHNRVPAYSMQLTAVAALDSVLGYSIQTNVKNITISSLQKMANNVANNLRSVL